MDINEIAVALFALEIWLFLYSEKRGPEISANIRTSTNEKISHTGLDIKASDAKHTPGTIVIKNIALFMPRSLSNLYAYFFAKAESNIASPNTKPRIVILIPAFLKFCCDKYFSSKIKGVVNMSKRIILIRNLLLRINLMPSRKNCIGEGLSDLISLPPLSSFKENETRNAITIANNVR